MSGKYTPIEYQNPIKRLLVIWIIFTVLIIAVLVCGRSVDPENYTRLQGPPENVQTWQPNTNISSR